ncbi:MAG: T9SS C-terminal target domain-containing protein [Cytophagales bacterium]|nr:MAG: T9SS C-terminal target domain-containing protein [Cytophagales bacterium]TAF61510.1 MAG: T9SS C-terminal target domain-containing protein [Cytophagales bacterium]
MNKLPLFLFCFLTVQVYAQSEFELANDKLPLSAIGGNTMDVRAADFNGDGFLDIVLAKEFQRNRIMFNDGKGNFTDVTAGRLTNVKHDSEDIAIADFDGNGWLDIVFASEDDFTHEMYLNTGMGNFTDVSNRLPQSVANAVVTTDINGDTFPDLIFGNEGQELLLINDGKGNFTDETALRLPTRNDVTQDLLLVDVDADKDLDIAVGNENGNRLLINDGTGKFADETLARLPQGVNMETRKVVTADVDSDGFADLFFCNMASVGGRDIRDRLYLNDGKGVFKDVSTKNLPREALQTFDAVFNDLNRDGHSDLLVAYLPNELPSVFINNGKGSFSDKTSDYLEGEASGNNIAAFLADFNADGKEDLYLGCFQEADKLFFRKNSSANDTSTVNDSSIVSSIATYELSQSRIVVYPNPASGHVNIEFNDLSKTSYNLEIINQSGQVVYTKTLDGSIQRHVIQLDNQPAGVYFLKISDGLKSDTQKLVIQR